MGKPAMERSRDKKVCQFIFSIYYYFENQRQHKALLPT
jgi:hypothetical protein